MKTIQAYRFALDLTPGQERAVRAHVGAARVAHNWTLARVKAVMDQRAAERSYGVPDELLTPSLPWSLAGLRKAWNEAKAKAAPWWGEVSKEAFNTGLDALARGLKNWADSRQGGRAGRPVGFPRFKSRRRGTPAVRFTTGAIRVEPDRRHVVLPRLGRLKLHESARKLARRIEGGTRGSCPPPCAATADGGTSRSPSRCSGPNGNRPGPPRWWGRMSESNILRCCPPASGSTTRATSSPRRPDCGRSVGRRRGSPAPTGAPAAAPRTAGNAPRTDLVAPMRESRTCAATGCTSSPRG
ncbi:helix-turn-helix domain-containing protein [Micromonospora sp. STR1s_5]|nr:helix-turn-helix domain-containing protein [Micromonospora sp. STR1s_5]